MKIAIYFLLILINSLLNNQFTIMKNVKSVSEIAKSVNAQISEKQNSEIVAKMSSKEKEALLQRLLAKMESGELKERSSSHESDMYRFQKLGKLSKDEQKQMRTKLRSKLEKHSNAVTLYYAMKYKALSKKDSVSAESHNKKLINAITDFISFYKAEYLVNDFSLYSLFRGAEEKKQEYRELLDIVKEYLADSAKDKQEKKEVKKVSNPAKDVNTKSETIKE